MSESPSTTLVRDICPPRRVCVSQGRRCDGADDCIEMREIDRTFFQIQSQSTDLPDLFVGVFIFWGLFLYLKSDPWTVFAAFISTIKKNGDEKHHLHQQHCIKTCRASLTFSVALFTYTRSTSRNYYWCPLGQNLIQLQSNR